MSVRVLIVSCAFALLSFACSSPASNNGDSCVPSCDGAACGDDGCGGECGSCVAGEVCNSGVCASPNCGNGALDEGETCDDSAGRGCATAAGCEPLSGCFSAAFSGAPESCDALCATTQIEVCVDGDGCCPTTCNPGSDRDCVPENCGNGVVDPGETCDEPTVLCLTAAECQPTHSCDRAVLIGYDFACSVSCAHSDITSCSMTSDGCCAEGCTYRTDADCAAPVCGNSIVEIDEVCDTGIVTGEGSCPGDCDDNRACTTDLLAGGDCTATCSYATQSACANGDGCCPPACTNANDNDCANVVCGDGVVDGNEGCDNTIPAGESGACPASNADCDDLDPCTTDMMMGNAGDCSARCVNAAIACADGDSCCPFTCTANNDAECDALDLCTTMCFRAVNYCMGANELFASTADCTAACRDMPTGRAADTSGATLYCRSNHLDDALNDPETHCPHGGATPTEGCVD